MRWTCTCGTDCPAAGPSWIARFNDLLGENDQLDSSALHAHADWKAKMQNLLRLVLLLNHFSHLMRRSE